VGARVVADIYPIGRKHAGPHCRDTWNVDFATGGSVKWLWRRTRGPAIPTCGAESSLASLTSRRPKRVDGASASIRLRSGADRVLFRRTTRSGSARQLPLFQECYAARSGFEFINEFGRKTSQQVRSVRHSLIPDRVWVWPRMDSQ